MTKHYYHWRVAPASAHITTPSIHHSMLCNDHLDMTLYQNLFVTNTVSSQDRRRRVRSIIFMILMTKGLRYPFHLPLLCKPVTCDKATLFNVTSSSYHTIRVSPTLRQVWSVIIMPADVILSTARDRWPQIFRHYAHVWVIMTVWSRLIPFSPHQKVLLQHAHPIRTKTLIKLRILSIKTPPNIMTLERKITLSTNAFDNRGTSRCLRDESYAHSLTNPDSQEDEGTTYRRRTRLSQCTPTKVVKVWKNVSSLIG